MNALEAMDRIVEWAESPERMKDEALIRVGAGTLQVTGPPGAGKTRLLEEVAGRFPGSILIDCRGRSRHDVFAELKDRLGAEQSEPIGATVRSQPGDVTLILTNTQWAGPVISTDEPNLLMWNASMSFLRVPSKRLVLIAECEDSRMAVGAVKERVIRLDGVDPPWEGELAGRRELRALAAAESDWVDARTWSTLCAALGQDVPWEELLSLADQYPHVLERGTPAGSGQVRFASVAVRSEVRRSLPLTAAEQGFVARSLWEASTGPGRDDRQLDGYVRSALAVHAARGRVLFGYLGQARFLTYVDRVGLLAGLTLAFEEEEGFTSNTMAVALLTVNGLGVRPSDHAEWVAWVHWAAMSCAERDLAAAIEDCGIDLPWRTVWSHWSDVGIRGSRGYGASQACGLAAGEMEGRPVVCGWIGVGETASSTNPTDFFHEWVIAPEDGEVLLPVQEIYGGMDQSGRLTAPSSARAYQVRPRDVPIDIQPGSPRLLPEVTDTLSFPGNLQVIAGGGGMFAIEILHADRTHEDAQRWHYDEWLQSRRSLYQLAWTMKCGVERIREQLSGRSGLESVLGQDVCRPMTNEEVPSGIQDPATREFLHLPGMPVLNDVPGLHHLSTITPRAVLSATGDDTSAHLIGKWAGRDLLLDGITGRVLRVDEASGGRTLMGTTLRTFWELVALSRVTGSGWDKARWAKVIDPEAAPAYNWY